MASASLFLTNSKALTRDESFLVFRAFTGASLVEIISVVFIIVILPLVY